MTQKTLPSASPRKVAKRVKQIEKRNARREKHAERIAKRGGASAVSVPLSTAREWASGIRLSGFMLLMFGIVLIGVWTLAPTLGTYLDQRAKIAAVDAQIDLTHERIAELERERERWADPAFLATQARERLYFVRPGETVYLINNDLDPNTLGLEPAAINANPTEADADWAATFLRSLTEAGSARAVTAVE